MNWKKWKSSLFQNFIVLCMLTIFIFLTSLHFRHSDAIYVVVFFLSSSINSICIEELKDRGYRKMLRIYFIYVLVAMTSLYILNFTKIIQGTILSILNGIICASFFALFPLVLYLNHKRKRLSPEATVADAN
jgi:hypothetical protein